VLASGGTLLGSAFGEAYIKPIYVDPSPTGWNTRGVVPFVAHAKDNFAVGVVSQDLTSAAGFWSITLVSAHENFDSTDGDPDGKPIPGVVPQPVQDAEIDYGLSNKGTGTGNVSLIFMESIQDAGPLEGVTMHAVVTHEIGHTAGYEIKHSEERGLGATGLLRESPSAFSSATGNQSFDNDAQSKMRSVVVWQCDPEPINMTKDSLFLPLLWRSACLSQAFL
jgi:hypothetical protein